MAGTSFHLQTEKKKSPKSPAAPGKKAPIVVPLVSANAAAGGGGKKAVSWG